MGTGLTGKPSCVPHSGPYGLGAAGVSWEIDLPVYTSLWVLGRAVGTYIWKGGGRRPT